MVNNDLGSLNSESPDLVLKNGKLINVFTGEIYRTDVAVKNGYIIGMGNYGGKIERDVSDKYLCPGLIHGHVHLENSMLQPREFAKAILPRGTTTIVIDPHEIANVCGLDGISYILQATENVSVNVFVMLPSSVPATQIDDNGATLNAEALKSLYGNRRVIGLAEVMNYPGVISGDNDIIEKIRGARENNLIVNGHAPGLTGERLCTYILAGVQSEHECNTYQEALEKVRLGQWIMVREGTASKNIDDLFSLLTTAKSQRCMLVTDDRGPSDLLNEGHLDFMIKKLIKKGLNPVAAVKMTTINPAQYYNLREVGAIAPGYKADIILVDDLANFVVSDVYKDGKLVARDGNVNCLNAKEVLDNKVLNTFFMRDLMPENLTIESTGEKVRVIGLVPGKTVTRELFFDIVQQADSETNFDLDLVKLAVAERYKATGRVGVSLVHGYGLKQGAIASSIAHDSHNVIVIGTNDEDMCLAANTVKDNQGGICITCNRRVLSFLPLPIAGLMSREDLTTVSGKVEELRQIAYELGVNTDIDPFTTLSFLSLPLIPEIRLTTRGLVRVADQRIIDTIVT